MWKLGKRDKNKEDLSGNSSNSHQVHDEIKTVMRHKRNQQEEFFEKALMAINELLTFMTRQDHIKDMLVDMDHQALRVEGVAASSQEVSASVTDISEFVAASSESTGKALKLTSGCIGDITGAFKQIEEAFVKTQEAQNAMHRVNDEADKISSMVAVIKQVADQTNLLALNASIEAARAGEAGRGFSVVADEIKKLADNTKQQVEQIQTLVASLSKEVTISTNAIDDATGSFSVGRQAIDKSMDGMDTMGTSLQGINNNFLEITANVEEQTAATEEMASSLSLINEQIQHLRSETNKTGEVFYTISKMVDSIRIEAIGHIDGLSIPNQLELCICDHLIWRWRVYNMILGFDRLSPEQVGTHKTCRLGKWVDNVGMNIDKYRSLLNEMEKPHAALHEQAARAIKSYNSGDRNKAESVLLEMDESSKAVIGILNRLKKL